MTEQETHRASLEVTWPLDGMNVYATLVQLSGSGPTDRDWNTPLLPGSNGSARLLAETLAKYGFVTLRYDKRVAARMPARTVPRWWGKSASRATWMSWPAPSGGLPTRPAGQE